MQLHALLFCMQCNQGMHAWYSRANARWRVRQVQPPCLAVDGVADARSPSAEGCAVTEWPTEADGGFAWWQVRAGERQAAADGRPGPSIKRVLEYSLWAAAADGSCVVADATARETAAVLRSAPCYMCRWIRTGGLT